MPFIHEMLKNILPLNSKIILNNIQLKINIQCLYVIFYLNTLTIMNLFFTFLMTLVCLYENWEI